MLVEAYAGAGTQPRRDRVARRADRRTIRGCCRRSPTSTSASGAGPMRRAPTRARSQRAPRNLDLKTRYALGAAERRRPRERRQGARRAHRGGGGARDRRARALPAVAGAAAARRLQRGRGDGAPGHRAEQQEPVGLLRARRSARGRGSSIRRSSTRSRRSWPRSAARRPTARSTSACCCRISASPIRSSDSTTRRSRRSRRRAGSRPSDPAVAGYLIEANIAAKKYGAAVELAQVGARAAPERSAAGAPPGAGAAPERQGRSGHRAARGGGQAARRRSGRLRRARAGLLRGGSRRRRPSRCCRTRRRSSRPTTAIAFELGAVFDKQKKFADAEAAFRQVLARDPENATALNYLGYMLAERGERLDESVGYLKKALQIEPENGVVSRQPRLGVLQGRQARSRRGQSEARRRSAEDQLRDPGSLRRRALQARTLRRSDRRVDARARRRRRLDRSRRTSTRRSGPRSRSSRRSERGLCPSCPVASFALLCLSRRRAARR